uniref:NADH dehydrogenase subunit 5 n=1 Tax=Cycetogamasus diviortus TaxID=2978624 RepID=UPI0022F2E02E|nr:NADH dehydrogenase subunit 5 [Cycetogamasus diviortus]WAK85128.1 NADH dehydrogenase subunit 5 [Cycetogamasus diviortus]
MFYIFWAMILCAGGLVFFMLGLISLTYMSKIILELILFSFYSVDIKFYFFFDWVSCLFVSVVMFISGMVVFYSNSYMEGESGKLKFLFLVLLFVISMILMILSPNMVMVLLGWDGLGLVSYCLVIYYQNESSNSAGMITVLTNRIGDVGMLLSIIFMLNFGGWSFFDFVVSGEMVYYVGCFMMLGAVTKSAQMPFSAWLPAAMAAPTPVSALVHSSTLVTAGVYLIIRMSEFYSNGNMSYTLMFMSVMTMFMSGLGANLETDLKKIIALSTLSQLGVMMMILSVGNYNLAFFHLVTHAMFKAMLFLCAGVVIHGIGGSQDIRSMGLMWNLSPLVSGMMTLSSLSLAGFPFLSGFYSKDMILEIMYMLNNNYIVLVFIMLATMFTVTYSLRLMYYGMWKGTLDSPVQGYAETKMMVFPIMMMGSLVIILGCVLSWLIFPHPIFIYLTFNVKVLNLFLVMFGGWIFFMNYNCVWKSGPMGAYTHFFGSMWFLPYITGGGFMETLKSSLFYHLSVDHGWMEEGGAMGANALSLVLFKNFSLSQKGDLKMMLVMMFLVFLFIIF